MELVGTAENGRFRALFDVFGVYRVNPGMGGFGGVGYPGKPVLADSGYVQGLSWLVWPIRPAG
jgi:hypothetical protein